MTVQHGAGFGVGLIDRQMQVGVHRGTLADHAVQVAFDQVAAAEGIGAAAGGVIQNVAPFRTEALPLWESLRPYWRSQW